MNMQPQPPTQTVVIAQPKSVGISILLTILFGPLGMLYSTVSGGLIMLAISVVVGLLTMGIGALITWPICVIWGAVAADNYNKRLLTTGAF